MIRIALVNNPVEWCPRACHPRRERIPDVKATRARGRVTIRRPGSPRVVKITQDVGAYKIKTEDVAPVAMLSIGIGTMRIPHGRLRIASLATSARIWAGSGSPFKRVVARARVYDADASCCSPRVGSCPGRSTEGTIYRIGDALPAG